MSLGELERLWRPKAFQNVEYEVQVTETVVPENAKKPLNETPGEEPEVQTITIPGPARRASLCISDGLLSPIASPSPSVSPGTNTTFRIRRLSVMDVPETLPVAKPPMQPVAPQSDTIVVSKPRRRASIIDSICLSNQTLSKIDAVYNDVRAHKPTSPYARTLATAQSRLTASQSGSAHTKSTTMMLGASASTSTHVLSPSTSTSITTSASTASPRESSCTSPAPAAPATTFSTVDTLAALDRKIDGYMRRRDADLISLTAYELAAGLPVTFRADAQTYAPTATASRGTSLAGSTAAAAAMGRNKASGVQRLPTRSALARGGQLSALSTMPLLTDSPGTSAADITVPPAPWLPRQPAAAAAAGMAATISDADSTADSSHTRHVRKPVGQPWRRTPFGFSPVLAHAATRAGAVYAHAGALQQQSALNHQLREQLAAPQAYVAPTPTASTPLSTATAVLYNRYLPPVSPPQPIAQHSRPVRPVCPDAEAVAQPSVPFTAQRPLRSPRQRVVLRAVADEEADRRLYERVAGRVAAAGVDAAGVVQAGSDHEAAAAAADLCLKLQLTHHARHGEAPLRALTRAQAHARRAAGVPDAQPRASSDVHVFGLPPVPGRTPSFADAELEVEVVDTAATLADYSTHGGQRTPMVQLRGARRFAGALLLAAAAAAQPPRSRGGRRRKAQAKAQARAQARSVDSVQGTAPSRAGPLTRLWGQLTQRHHERQRSLRNKVASHLLSITVDRTLTSDPTVAPQQYNPVLAHSRSRSSQGRRTVSQWLGTTTADTADAPAADAIPQGPLQYNAYNFYRSRRGLLKLLRKIIGYVPSYVFDRACTRMALRLRHANKLFLLKRLEGRVLHRLRARWLDGTGAHMDERLQALRVQDRAGTADVGAADAQTAAASEIEHYYQRLVRAYHVQYGCAPEAVGPLGDVTAGFAAPSALGVESVLHCVAPVEGENAGWARVARNVAARVRGLHLAVAVAGWARQAATQLVDALQALYLRVEHEAVLSDQSQHRPRTNVRARRSSADAHRPRATLELPGTAAEDAAGLPAQAVLDVLHTLDLDGDFHPLPLPPLPAYPAEPASDALGSTSALEDWLVQARPLCAQCASSLLRAYEDTLQQGFGDILAPEQRAATEARIGSDPDQVTVALSAPDGAVVPSDNTLGASGGAGVLEVLEAALERLPCLDSRMLTEAMHTPFPSTVHTYALPDTALCRCGAPLESAGSPEEVEAAPIGHADDHTASADDSESCPASPPQAPPQLQLLRDDTGAVDELALRMMLVTTKHTPADVLHLPVPTPVQRTAPRARPNSPLSVDRVRTLAGALRRRYEELHRLFVVSTGYAWLHASLTDGIHSLLQHHAEFEARCAEGAGAEEVHDSADRNVAAPKASPKPYASTAPALPSACAAAPTGGSLAQKYDSVRARVHEEAQRRARQLSQQHVLQTLSLHGLHGAWRKCRLHTHNMVQEAVDKAPAHERPPTVATTARSLSRALSRPTTRMHTRHSRASAPAFATAEPSAPPPACLCKHTVVVPMVAALLDQVTRDTDLLTHGALMPEARHAATRASAPAGTSDPAPGTMTSLHDHRATLTHIQTRPDIGPVVHTDPGCPLYQPWDQAHRFRRQLARHEALVADMRQQVDWVLAAQERPQELLGSGSSAPMPLLALHAPLRFRNMSALVRFPGAEALVNHGRGAWVCVNYLALLHRALYQALATSDPVRTHIQTHTRTQSRGAADRRTPAATLSLRTLEPRALLHACMHTYMQGGTRLRKLLVAHTNLFEWDAGRAAALPTVEYAALNMVNEGGLVTLATPEDDDAGEAATAVPIVRGGEGSTSGGGLAVCPTPASSTPAQEQTMEGTVEGAPEGEPPLEEAPPLPVLHRPTLLALLKLVVQQTRDHQRDQLHRSLSVDAHDADGATGSSPWNALTAAPKGVRPDGSLALSSAPTAMLVPHVAGLRAQLFRPAPAATEHAPAQQGPAKPVDELLRRAVADVNLLVSPFDVTLSKNDVEKYRTALLRHEVLHGRHLLGDYKASSARDSDAQRTGSRNGTPAATDVEGASLTSIHASSSAAAALREESANNLFPHCQRPQDLFATTHSSTAPPMLAGADPLVAVESADSSASADYHVLANPYRARHVVEPRFTTFHASTVRHNVQTDLLHHTRSHTQAQTQLQMRLPMSAPTPTPASPPASALVLAPSSDAPSRRHSPSPHPTPQPSPRAPPRVRTHTGSAITLAAAPSARRGSNLSLPVPLVRVDSDRAGGVAATPSSPTGALTARSDSGGCASVGLSMNVSSALPRVATVAPHTPRSRTGRGAVGSQWAVQHRKHAKQDAAARRRAVSPRPSPREGGLDAGQDSRSSLAREQSSPPNSARRARELTAEKVSYLLDPRSLQTHPHRHLFLSDVEWGQSLEDAPAAHSSRIRGNEAKALSVDPRSRSSAHALAARTRPSQQLAEHYVHAHRLEVSVGAETGVIARGPRMQITARTLPALASGHDRTLPHVSVGGGYNVGTPSPASTHRMLAPRSAGAQHLGDLLSPELLDKYLAQAGSYDVETFLLKVKDKIDVDHEDSGLAHIPEELLTHALRTHRRPQRYGTATADADDTEEDAGPRNEVVADNHVDVLAQRLNEKYGSASEQDMGSVYMRAAANSKRLGRLATRESNSSLK